MSDELFRVVDRNGKSRADLCHCGVRDEPKKAQEIGSLNQANYVGVNN